MQKPVENNACASKKSFTNPFYSEPPNLKRKMRFPFLKEAILIHKITNYSFQKAIASKNNDWLNNHFLIYFTPFSTYMPLGKLS